VCLLGGDWLGRGGTGGTTDDEGSGIWQDARGKTDAHYEGVLENSWGTIHNTRDQRECTGVGYAACHLGMSYQDDLKGGKKASR